MPRAPTILEGVQDAEHSTVELLAAAVGRSRQTVHEWFKAGCPSDKPYSEVRVRLWARAAGIDGLTEPAPAVAALLGTAAAPRAAKEPDRKQELEAELLQRKLDQLDGRLLPLEAVEHLVDALAAATVEQLGELAEQAVAALFPPIAEGSHPSPLSSSVVRDQVARLVRDARMQTAASFRLALRRHLDARAPDVPPGAGTGGAPS